ncbi:MAG: CD1375 family protein [Intestinimonas sp.]
MLMIELAALENGAHRNQWTDGAITPPDGWAAVPEELEAKAAGYLPYILLTVEEGEITGVAQGAVPTPTLRPSRSRTRSPRPSLPWRSWHRWSRTTTLQRSSPSRSWLRRCWEVRQVSKLYVDLIRKGLKTIDDVPLRWRDEVQALLEEAQV